MGSRSTQPAGAATKMTFAPVMTFQGQKDLTWSMAYSPDGKRIISISHDNTIRQWDLKAGKEIEEVRDVYEGNLYLAVVSRDGRWVMTSGEDEEYNLKELKTYEVETGIVKTFQDSRYISCIDISADGKLLASGSFFDRTVLIWGMDTGELVAGPFKSDDRVDIIRFSPDSKKLAVESEVKKCLEVWDVQTQKLDAQLGKTGDGYVTHAPIFWTKKGTILAVFNFDFDYGNSEPTTIYEFDASTVETVGDPFRGHTDIIDDLALSSDGTLLASSSFNNIKLWSIEPHQLLASFHLQHKTGGLTLSFSPDIRQLAYWADHKIFICNTPPDILASIRVTMDAQAMVGTPDNSTLKNDLLNSDATRRPANVRRNPATSPMISLPPRPLQPMHTRGLEQPGLFRHLRNLLSFSSHWNAVPPVRNDHPLDPLDIPATSSRIHYRTPVANTTQGHSHSDLSDNPQRIAVLPTTLSSASSPATLGARIQHLSRWWPAHTSHQASPIVDVPLAHGLLRHAAAGAPDNDGDLIPEEYFDTSSQNPGSQQPSAAAQIDIGEHGHGRSCFCF